MQAAQRVLIASGQTVPVTLHIALHALAYFDEAQRQWQLDAGCYQVLVGASSRDIRLHDSVTLTADTIAAGMGNRAASPAPSSTHENHNG